MRIDHLPDYAAGIAALKPGTLDDRSWLSPAMHFWTSSREAWVELPVDVVQHPRQP